MNRFAALLAIVCVVAMSVNPVPPARTALADDACQSPGSLCAMLNLTPDLLNDPSGSYNHLYYDNYTDHLSRFDFTPPTTFEGQGWTNFVAISFDLSGAGQFLPYLTFWEEQMGYSPFLIDQVIEYGRMPDSLTLLRGRFDRSSVESWWSQSGYTPTTVNGAEIWKLRGDHEQDVLNRPLLGSSRYNYAVFVREDVIAYSTTAMGINATVQTAAGLAPALASNSTIVQLLAHVPPDLASAMLGSGESFANSSAWTIFGVSPGNPVRTDSGTGTPEPIPADTPLKRAYAALLYGPGVDLNQTAAAISNTFLSGSVARAERPYTDFFQDLNVTVDSQASVVAVNYAPLIENRSNLFSFLIARDLGFLV